MVMCRALEVMMAAQVRGVRAEAWSRNCSGSSVPVDSSLLADVPCRFTETTQFAGTVVPCASFCFGDGVGLNLSLHRGPELT